jgi:hypothetical protein
MLTPIQMVFLTLAAVLVLILLMGFLPSKIWKRRKKRR